MRENQYKRLPPIERRQDGSLYRMTPAQRKQANALIRRECCCYEDGNCMFLDDGDTHTCPQTISFSVCCKWFRWSVLPQIGTLEAEIFRVRLALQHDEGRVVFGPFFRVNPQAVGEVDQPAQMVERALGNQLVHMLEYRAEVGRRLADQLKVVHIVAQAALAGDAPVRAELVVALQDAQVDLPEKALAVL